MSNFFTKNLAHLIDKSGFKQSLLSKEIGIGYSTLSNWKNGVSRPDYEHLIKISNYFEVKIDDLLKRDLSKGEVINSDFENGLKMYNALERQYLGLEALVQKHCPDLAEKLKLN